MKIERALKSIFVIIIPFVWASGVWAISIKHGPYLQNVSDTEATIVWVADKPSVGWVELAQDDGTNFYAEARPKYFDTKTGIMVESKVHAVRVTGLKPDTKYYYRVCAKEIISHKGWHVTYGNVASTDAWVKGPDRFTTQDSHRETASVLVVNDIHERNDVLKVLLSNGNYAGKDGVFFNGDMISLFDTEDKFFNGFMDTAVATFAARQPLYYVRGNHETRGQWASKFHDYVCPRHQTLYFTVRIGPVMFICLDTGEDKPDTDVEYYGLTDYDNYRSEQAAWLRKLINSDEYKRAKYHVVLAHIPPINMGGTDWHGDVEVRKKFVPVLNEAKIDLLLCGHTHRFGFQAITQGYDFPMLINSNNAVVTIDAEDKGLRIRVIEMDGKVGFERVFGR